MEDLVMYGLPSPDFWSGKRVLITGHTGFKGCWLTIWLHQMGAEVFGIALEPATRPSLFDLAGVAKMCDSQICDVRDADRLTRLVEATRADIVLHLAAQPLVRESFANPVETFAINVLGTAHLLQAVRSTSTVRVVVAVTTDKVYDNLETIYPYREHDSLGGHDPYSASKAAAEIVAASYRASFLKEQGIVLATARAGNVIGGGDWSADRLIPDAVRAWTSAETLHIRRPDAVRPWQHVLEPASAYLRLAERLSSDANLAGAYNFGPRTDESASVRTVVTIAREAFGQGEVAFADTIEGPHEAGLLTLETAKAKALLGVQPRWSLQEGVTRTIAWYRSVGEGANAYSACRNDLSAYGSLR